MRPKERIPLYLSLWKSKLEKIDYKTVQLPLPPKFPGTLIIPKDQFESIFQEISEIWESHPDWRLSQLLVNTGLYANYPGFWYYTEDYDFMKSLGFPDSEIFLWGTYGKNGDEPLHYLILKDMKYDHIEAILNNCKLTPATKKILEQHLHYGN